MDRRAMTMTILWPPFMMAVLWIDPDAAEHPREPLPEMPDEPFAD